MPVIIITNNPDTKIHPAILRQQGVLRPEHLLDLHRALHRIHHTGKLRQHAISRSINDPAPMVLDTAAHHLPVFPQSADSRFLICAHKTAITLDIRTEYGSKLAFKFLGGHGLLRRIILR